MDRLGGVPNEAGRAVVRHQSELSTGAKVRNLGKEHSLSMGLRSLKGYGSQRITALGVLSLSFKLVESSASINFYN